jgi:hypothetical protein
VTARPFHPGTPTGAASDTRGARAAPKSFGFKGMRKYALNAGGNRLVGLAALPGMWQVQEGRTSKANRISAY